MTGIEKQQELNLLKQVADSFLNNEFPPPLPPDFDIPTLPGQFMRGIRENLAGQDFLTHDNQEINVHGGIDRMTGLIQMVENANESGKPIPHIIMRDKNNHLIDIHTQEKIRPLLDALSESKNRVESAHNKVMPKYQAIADRRDDTSQSLDSRILNARLAITFLSNYQSELMKEMELYDADTLPTDLGELKSTYIERLEATALARQKHLRGILTEQGNKLHSSCHDEAQATQHVAATERAAAIRVGGADDADEAKSAYDAGITAINAITPLNTPVWTIDGTDYDANHPTEIALEGNSMRVIAKNPDAAGIPEDMDAIMISISSKQSIAFSQTRRTSPDPALARATIIVYALTAPTAGETYRFDLTARNLCGPSQVTVALTVPTP